MRETSERENPVQNHLKKNPSTIIIPPAQQPHNSTIYFENYPNNHDSSTLKSIFCNLFPFSEIRLIKTKNKAGRNYGFINCEPADTQKIIKILNGIWIVDSKIRANVAKFHNQSKHQPKVTPVILPRQTLPRSIPVKLRDHRSYADVTNGFNTQSKGKISMIYNNGEIPNWLSMSCVGILHSFESIPSIHDQIRDRFPGTQTRLLGGKMILVTFASAKEKIDSFAVQNKPWINDTFEVWKEWEIHDVAEGRFVWLNLIRIPIHVWKEDFFKSLVCSYGDFICLNSETEGKKRFDIAKVLICTNRKNHIQETIKIQIDDESYEITIIEDRLQELLFIDPQIEPLPSDSRREISSPEDQSIVGETPLSNQANVTLDNLDTPTPKITPDIPTNPLKNPKSSLFSDGSINDAHKTPPNTKSQNPTPSVIQTRPVSTQSIPTTIPDPTKKTPNSPKSPTQNSSSPLVNYYTKILKRKTSQPEKLPSPSSSISIKSVDSETMMRNKLRILKAWKSKKKIQVFDPAKAMQLYIYEILYKKLLT